jgi:hypothetical protein
MALYMNLRRRRIMEIVTLGLDLGKNWVHMMGFDGEGGSCCGAALDGAGLRR